MAAFLLNPLTLYVTSSSSMRIGKIKMLMLSIIHGGKDMTEQTGRGGRFGRGKGAEGGNRRVMLTRVWDRKAGKLAGEIEDAVAVGPGPTKTTMVLDRYGGISSLKIHDAASGKTWKLASEHPIRLTGATGKYILYIRPNEKREKILCRARIALGK